MTSDSNLGIASVGLDGQSVRVEWTDGHVSDFTAIYLRVNCSCAECVEEWTNRRLLDPASLPADLKAEDYLPVGQVRGSVPVERRTLHRHLPVRDAA